MTMATTPLPVTQGRRTALIIGVPVALALIAVCVPLWSRAALMWVASTDRIGYPVALRAPVQDGRVRVTSNNGDLVYRTSAGAQQISVRGHLSGSLARPTFSHHDTAAGLALDSSCNVPFGTCDTSFTVTGPAGLPVTLKDAFGNLTASHLPGPVSLSDNSGDIFASDLVGQIRLNDQFGNINAGRLHGSIRVLNNSGDINLLGATGPIQLNDQFGNINSSQLDGSTRLVNNSGDINVSGATGDTRLQDAFGNIYVVGLAAASAVATNNSGDITLRFAAVPRQVNVTDSFGNVTLILPAGNTAYRVQTHNSFGNTDVSVRRSPTSAHLIQVHNNSGNITIITHSGPPPSQPPAPAAAAQH
jgi:Putative adhesin